MAKWTKHVASALFAAALVTSLSSQPSAAPTSQAVAVLTGYKITYDGHSSAYAKLEVKGLNEAGQQVRQIVNFSNRYNDKNFEASVRKWLEECRRMIDLMIFQEGKWRFGDDSGSYIENTCQIERRGQGLTTP